MVLLTPTDDTYVYNSYPDNQYSGRSDMDVRLDSDNDRRTYAFVKFNIPDVNIKSAKLRLYIDDVEDPGNISIKDIQDNWTGSSLTWNNKDINYLGKFTITSSISTADDETWKEYEFTAPAKHYRGKTLAMIISPQSDPVFIDIHTKEGSNSPEIIIEEEEDPEPVPVDNSIPEIVSGTVTPAIAKPGEIIIITAGLKNIGTGTGNWTWNYEITGIGGIHKSISLGAGETKTDTQSTSLTAALAPGKYALSVYLAEIYKTFPEVLTIEEEEEPEPPEGWVQWFVNLITSNLPEAINLSTNHSTVCSCTLLTILFFFCLPIFNLLFIVWKITLMNNCF